MTKHLTPAEFKAATKKYATDRDPEDLGVEPTLTKSKPTTELKEDKAKLLK